MITFYDAFAGIGGFRLGLERAGFKCVGSCEIDEYARKVYHKNFGEWPDRDIRDVSSINGADMLCGGFPCQDISVAGKGAGLSGERSGLWWELARLIENCSPRLIFLENVPALTTRGLGDILGFLADGGHDAEWECIPASAFGAPHRRDRIWIVARRAWATPNPDSAKLRVEREWEKARKAREEKAEPSNESEEKSLANPTEVRLQEREDKDGHSGEKSKGGNGNSWGSSDKPRGFWTIEPAVGRVVDGVPHRMDRLRCLGNAVVPQVVEWIGRRLGESEDE